VGNDKVFTQRKRLPGSTVAALQSHFAHGPLYFSGLLTFLIENETGLAVVNVGSEGVPPGLSGSAWYVPCSFSPHANS
jgi:hypothetical protein